LKDLDVFILNLAKLFKAVSFYPENHPTLVNALKKMAEDINDFANATDLVIEIGKDGFTIKGQKFYPTQPILKDLAQSLTLRRVNKVLFHSGVSYDELLSFFKLINMEVGTLYAAGGLEVLMETSDIRNIALSEVHLTKLLSKPQKVKTNGKVANTSDNLTSAEEGEEKDKPEEKKVDGLVSGHEIHNEEKHKSVDEQYLEAVNILQTAMQQKNIGEYLKGLKMAGDLLALFDWKEEYKYVLDLLNLVVDAKNDQNSAEGIRREAGRFIYNAANEARLNSIIDVLLQNSENEEVVKKILSVLSAVGEPAVEAILDRLTTANDIKTRRMLINQIIKLGDIAFERVIYHLADERWYVVRNMVTILGVFAKPESLDKLFEVAKHPDVRVRKEVIKTLARIKHPKVFPFLREMLLQESDDIRLLIVFSLGIMKSVDAIEDIAKIVETEKNLNLRKEALVALGRIGTEKVFQMLKTYALKKSFFNKAENKVLRLAAINGLGEIKTSECATVLEKLLKDSDPDIRDTAFEALQKVKFKAGV